MRNLLDYRTALSASAFCVIAICLELGFGSVRGVASAHEGEHGPADAGVGEPTDVNRVYAEAGDWIELPELPGRDGRTAAGSCKVDIGVGVSVHLEGHGHANPRLPDDAWAELAGRWQPFAAQIQASDLQVQFEVICGTSFNADIEFFTSPWLPLVPNDRPDYLCPEAKPVLMAARCQTSTAAP